MWPQAAETRGTRLRLWEAGAEGREQALRILKIGLPWFYSQRVSERLRPKQAARIGFNKSRQLGRLVTASEKGMV